MKKTVISMLLCIMTIAASAQIKSVDIKGDLRGDFGIGAGVTMGIVNKIDLSPRFNYYFTGKGSTVWTIDADFHYNINVAQGWKVYPILGLAYYHWSVDVDQANLSESSGKLGCNLGCGVKYDIKDNIGVFVEGKYQYIDGYDDSYFSVGVNIGI